MRQERRASPTDFNGQSRSKQQHSRAWEARAVRLVANVSAIISALPLASSSALTDEEGEPPYLPLAVNCKILSDEDR